MNMRGMRLLKVFFNLGFVSVLSLSVLHSEEFAVTVSPERAVIIEEIVVTMGDTNLLLLKFKEKHLRDLSKQLRGMGSLNFLGYIFTHSELKDRMGAIYGSTFKWNGFMESVRKGFEREKASGTLFTDIPGFARLFGLRESALMAKVAANDWDGFVVYLMEQVR